MINRRNITKTISEAVGQIIGFALLLAVAICLLLLIPGISILSWINDLSGNQIPTLELWLGGLIISGVLYGLIRFLMKDPDVTWKVYGGLCISVLILCIILSVGFQQHFGQRWTKRLMGMTAVQPALTP
ncbi:MAG: hypothetical protein WCP60_10560 [bacterium]